MDLCPIAKTPRERQLCLARPRPALPSEPSISASLLARGVFAIAATCVPEGASGHNRLEAPGENDTDSRAGFRLIAREFKDWLAPYRRNDGPYGIIETGP